MVIVLIAYTFHTEHFGVPDIVQDMPSDMRECECGQHDSFLDGFDDSLVGLPPLPDGKLGKFL